MQETHFEVLGVSRNASFREIKARFHSLARAHHPDKNSTVQDEEFCRIQQAWEILREDLSRRAYTESLEQAELKAKSKKGGVVALSWQDLEEAFDEETGDTIFIYDCRCGEEAVFDSSGTVECPGCCFSYELSPKLAAAQDKPSNGSHS